MKFSLFIVSAVIAAVSAMPLEHVRRDVDPNQVPQFGVTPNTNPTGTGDCDGITRPDGSVVKIPCFCPPDRASFIASLNANVAAGHVVNNPGVAVSFPSDGSKDSQLARLQTAIVTLQNLRGPGVGCPAASTTFLAQQAAVQAGTAPPPPPAAPPPAAPAPPPAAPPAPATVAGINVALVPDFGIAAGQNPTGTGDCSGLNGIKIPCSCPPDRNDFITKLAANAAAGHATNNPGVALSFPTDDSKNSKVARIQASIITLQNLNGPGVGCPAASTTFSAQLAAALAA